MNLPFGIRNIDHTLWVRKATRTDINTAQQHGVAFSYSGETLRGEVMGILGNFQIHPDAYRERGAVGYLEYTLSPHYTAGVNGLFTSALLDTATGTTRKRGSAGIFGRGSPTLPLVLMAEADALFDAQAGASTTLGVVGMLQADYEPKQGIHVLGTGELRVDPAGVSAGGWLGAAWFFLPQPTCASTASSRAWRPRADRARSSPRSLDSSTSISEAVRCAGSQARLFRRDRTFRGRGFGVGQLPRRGQDPPRACERAAVRALSLGRDDRHRHRHYALRQGVRARRPRRRRTPPCSTRRWLTKMKT